MDPNKKLTKREAKYTIDESTSTSKNDDQSVARVIEQEEGEEEGEEEEAVPATSYTQLVVSVCEKEEATPITSHTELVVPVANEEEATPITSYTKLVVPVAKEEATHLVEPISKEKEAVQNTTRTTIEKPSNSSTQSLRTSDSNSESEIWKIKTEFDREVMENTIKNRRLSSEDSTDFLKVLHSQKNFHNLHVAEESTDDGPKSTKQLKKSRNIRFRPEDSEIKFNEFNFHKRETDENQAASSGTQTSLATLKSEKSEEKTEFELFFDGDDEVDEDEEDKDLLKTPNRNDTITSKMELLKFFEIPSISDLSDDSEDS